MELRNKIVIVDNSRYDKAQGTVFYKIPDTLETKFYKQMESLRTALVSRGRGLF